MAHDWRRGGFNRNCRSVFVRRSFVQLRFFVNAIAAYDKKLSYRRETARQLRMST